MLAIYAYRVITSGLLRNFLVGFLGTCAVALIVGALGITVASVGDPVFRQSFPAEFAANLLGTLLAAVIAIGLFVYEQRMERERWVEAQRQEEVHRALDRIQQEERERQAALDEERDAQFRAWRQKVRVVTLLLQDVHRQWEWLERRRVGGAGGVNRTLETPFFNNFLWLAITNAGDLRYLDDYVVVAKTAEAYERLELSGWLERRLWSLVEGQQASVTQIYNATAAERAVELADAHLRPALEAAMQALTSQSSFETA